MAAYDVESKLIQGRTYTAVKMPGVRGRKVLLQLMRVAGPVVEHLEKIQKETETEGEEIEKKIDFAVLSEALDRIFENLTDERFEWFLKEFTINSTVTGDEPGQLWDLSQTETQNAVWGDGPGYRAMFEFMRFWIGVNFSGFFGVSRPKGAKVKKPCSDPTAVPATNPAG